MRLNKREYAVRWSRGQGNGGQHRNKTENCCNLTHIATGIMVRVDGRSRRENMREAYYLLQDRLKDYRDARRAGKRKKRRDAAIKAAGHIRTYNKSRGVVIDHRSGKSASWKDIVVKGQIDKLR